MWILALILGAAAIAAGLLMRHKKPDSHWKIPVVAGAVICAAGLVYLLLVVILVSGIS